MQTVYWLNTTKDKNTDKNISLEAFNSFIPYNIYTKIFKNKKYCIVIFL